MLTLLGSLLGFLSSTFPEFLKLFRDSQDRKHELAILDRQMEQQRLGHSSVLQAGMCGIDLQLLQQGKTGLGLHGGI